MMKFEKNICRGWAYFQLFWSVVTSISAEDNMIVDVLARFDVLPQTGQNIDEQLYLYWFHEYFIQAFIQLYIN